MTQGSSRLERFLEGAARVASGSGLHPLVILQEVESAAAASIRDGAVANAYRVALAPSDMESLEAYEPQLRAGIRRTLDELRASRGVNPPAAWQIEVLGEESTRSGSVRVEASFKNVAASARHSPAGVTEVVTRIKGKLLVTDRGDAVRLTHTPFTIGREAGCDLVILDFSMSRRHARIESGTAGALVMRDLGSRNKLIVDGAPGDEVVLEIGTRVTLGATTLWIEEAGA